jgi:hypothetical protein
MPQGPILLFENNHQIDVSVPLEDEYEGETETETEAQ